MPSSKHPICQTVELLVAFVDLTNFARVSHNKTCTEVFDLCAGFFEGLGKIITEAGGTVVKPIGDAALITFPKNKVDAGVLALLQSKLEVDQMMQAADLPCRLIVKAHFGEVATGTIVAGSSKWHEVYGETVNIAATLESKGFAISPQLFRCLGTESRRLFKKHTPPMTYIPLSERHT